MDQKIEVELQLRGMPSPSQVSSLIESKLDAEILRMPVTNRKLISVPLFCEYLVLATPADVIEDDRGLYGRMKLMVERKITAESSK